MRFIPKEIERSATPAYAWSVKKIIIRVFTYPLCICVLFLGMDVILSSLKTKSIIAGIATMAVVVIYLYTDLKLLLNKKRRKTFEIN